jgi:hypothetical protein
MGEYYFVNLWQTNEERRDKYLLCIALGAKPWQAQRMRDWRLSKIERLYHLLQTNKRKLVSERISSLFGQQPLKLQFNKAE